MLKLLPPCVLGAVLDDGVRRRAQENGEYGEAILLCVQCFQNVETLKDLKVGSRTSIRRDDQDANSPLTHGPGCACNNCAPVPKCS